VSPEAQDFSEPEQEFGPSFGQLSPQEIERTNLFPAYPKSHINGYATIVDLPTQIASIDRVTKLRNALQYSLTKGAGKRTKVVQDDEGNDVKMSYHYRQCAGVKICEFMPEDLRGPHTHVDSDDLQWAKLLAAQEQAEAATHVGEIAMVYEEWSKRTCDKYEILGGQCGGQAVIRSLKPTSASSIYSRLFIGCKKWTQRSKGHTFVSLSGYDPVTVLQLWGRDRCYGIHDDFKQLMDGKWHERTQGIIQLKPNTKYQMELVLSVMQFIQTFKEVKMENVPFSIRWEQIAIYDEGKLFNYHAKSNFIFSNLFSTMKESPRRNTWQF
jgi:hypothetical protein